MRGDKWNVFIEDQLYDFKKEYNIWRIKSWQQTHIVALTSPKEALSAQTNKLQESVEFMSAKYDEVLELTQIES